MNSASNTRLWRFTSVRLKSLPPLFPSHIENIGHSWFRYSTLSVTPQDHRSLSKFHTQTASTIQSFFLAMTLHPAIQRRAQAELDAVVGPDRLPTMADRPRLPYVNALALEVLRSHVVAPTGVPHRVMEDDVYEGYFIPKGSLVLANLWCVVWEGSGVMRALMREKGSCCTTSGRIVGPWSSGRRGSSRRYQRR